MTTIKSSQKIASFPRRSPNSGKKAPMAEAGGNVLQLDLNPGLRDRIISEMDASKIQEEQRLQYLCLMTGRAPQTARRWLAQDKPGLPDLMSFALLCLRFDADANWLLGLTQEKFSLPKDHSLDDTRRQALMEWIDALIKQVSPVTCACEVMIMQGDDMEPRIKNGAPMLVDTGIDEIAVNGTYVLAYQGRTLVRHVEMRIGEGVVLTCENPKYKPTVIKDTSRVNKLGLRVIGRVVRVLNAEKF